MIDSAQLQYQANLATTFKWMLHIYEQGLSLLDAASKIISDEPDLDQLLKTWCATGSRARTDRFVWLDVDFYGATEITEVDQTMFIGISYTSKVIDRVGCHLIAGLVEIEPGISALVNNTSQTAHWIVDRAINSKTYPGDFTSTERDDGLTYHVPSDSLDLKFREGLKGLTAATIPVAWIDSDDKLTNIIRSAIELYRHRGEHPELGALSKQSRADVNIQDM